MHLKSSQGDLCMPARGSSVPRHEGEGAALLPHWAADVGQAGCPPISPDIPVWQPLLGAPRTLAWGHPTSLPCHWGKWHQQKKGKTTKGWTLPARSFMGIFLVPRLFTL